MKLTLNKIVFYLMGAVFFLCCSCTYTPWHRQQAEIFLNKGISFLQVGQYNKALKELLESEKYYSDNPKVHYYMGMTYHGKGMREKAYEEFKNAIALDANYSEAHNYLGTMYMDDGLWDQAIAEFDKALANPIYETPAMAIYNSAWAYYSKKDYKTALARYYEALRADPRTHLRPQIEKNIGLIYYDRNEFPDAIRHLKNSIDLDASVFDAHFLLGQSYLKIKDYKNARKEFQTVIQLAPDSDFARRARNYLQSLK